MWIHAKPDANALQTDPAFNDLQGFPLFARRLDSAFDPWSNSIAAPGVARTRTIHVGIHARQEFLSEGASSTLLPQGASDYLTHPVYNTINDCVCAEDGRDPGGLPTYVLTPTSANGTHYYGLTIAFPAGDNVVSFYVKANGYTGLGIGLWDANNSTYLQGNFDLSTGMASGGITVSSDSLGGGWYRVWCSRSFAAGGSGSSNISINIGQNISTFSYAGDGVSGILVTQPSVEPGRVKPSSWISSKNLCPHSTDVSDGSWGPEQLTVTAAQAADPLSGLMTAALLTEDSTSNIHVISQTVAAINGLYLCHSVYYKPTGRTWILLNNGPTGNGCWFNCSGAGTVGSPNGTIGSSGITALSGPYAGWYFCWFTSQAGTSNNAQAYTSTGDLVSSYLGTGISCGYLADYQVEPVGLAVTPYPDPLNLVQGASNLANATFWGGGIVGVSTFVTDPFGGADAFTITNGSGGPYAALFQNLTDLPAGPVLISVYVKWGNTTQTAFQLYDATASTGRGFMAVGWNGSGVITGTGTDGGITILGFLPMAGGWYRLMALSAAGIVPGHSNAIYVYPGVVGAEATGDFCYAMAPQVTALAPTGYWGVNAAVGGRETDGIYANIAGIVDSRVNYLYNSEQFENGWIYNNITIAANAGTDPNGNMYADDIVETGTSVNQFYVAQGTVGSAGNWVYLCRIKPTGRTWCTLQMYDTGLNQTVGQYFGLSGSGTVGVAAGNTPNNATITGPDSKGYYRCVLFVTLVGPAYVLVVSALSNGNQNIAGLNASALRLFGAQAVPGTVDPGPEGYIPTQAAVTSPQIGLSTTKGSMIAVATPYDGNAGSGNYYTHVGNADFVMDPAGQWYRDASYNGAAVTQVLGVLNMAMVTWDVEADQFNVYPEGVPGASVTLGEGHCPLTANVTGIPIGSLFGTFNMEGWTALFYVHGRAYNAAEAIVFKNAIVNA